MAIRSRLALVSTAAFLAAGTQAQEPACAPGLSSPYGIGIAASGTPRDLIVFDDGSGSGPELYAAGLFSLSVKLGTNPIRSGIVRWENPGWSHIGPPLGANSNNAIRALAVFDGGSGPELVLGGDYPHEVQRWTGTSWAPLGTGVGVEMGADVRDLVVFDDGSGPVLVACGDFDTMEGLAVNSVAQWDGAAWSPLGAGVSGVARALAVFDDGSGPDLYVCGTLTDVAGSSAKFARWDGASWSKVGGGINGVVNALTVLDAGTIQALFAAGDFTSVAGQPANRVARWDGTSWSALGSGVDGEVLALGVHDDGNGPVLFAGGTFTTAGGVIADGVARWDGTAWSALDPGGSHPTFSFAAFDDGGGDSLFLGAVVSAATGKGLRRWDGANLSVLGNGMNGLIRVAEVLDAGSGPALYVGGDFTVLGGVAADRVARWNGSAWEPLGAGFAGPVHDLEVYDDGNGPALFAAADFSPNGVHRWDGATWTSIGILSQVRCLGVHDDGQGGGPQLYAGGDFTLADGVTASRIARWDGLTWSAVGEGFTGGGNPSVRALHVFDDGSGPVLVAGGDFSHSGSTTTREIASWDGAAWTGIWGGSDTGITSVYSLATYDTGSGPRLFTAGLGSVPVAVWNEPDWDPIGATGVIVRALAVADDGSGLELYAGGLVNGGQFAKWNGSTWTSLDAGLNPIVEAYTVAPLAGLPGGGSSLAVGGEILLERWGSDCDPPVFYCTAKTSSSGCVAVMGTSDPTAQPTSGAGDYAVTASNVQGLKNGHVFVGISGPAALPFLGGTLCVMPPTKRGPTQNSGGSGRSSCDGSYSYVVNDGLVIPFGHDAGPGNSAWYQWWYRDPLNGAGNFGSSFSDAVQLDFD